MAILDSFHFSTAGSVPITQNDDMEVDEEGNKKEGKDGPGSSAEECHCLPQHIQTTIVKTILPSLESCLTKEVRDCHMHVMYTSIYIED